MDTGKKRAPWAPARIEPPDPLAPSEVWISYSAGLGALEARLRVSHPDLDLPPRRDRQSQLISVNQFSVEGERSRRR